MPDRPAAASARFWFHLPRPYNRNTGPLTAPQPAPPPLSAAEMFKPDRLRALVRERLTAAAEDIFLLFEQTIRDYEETLLRARRDTDARGRLQERTAPLQKQDPPSERDHCERTTAPAGEEQDRESPQIKEELEERLSTGEKQEDTKDSLFNIIYVQRSDEGGGQPNQEPGGGKEEGCLPGASSQQLKSEASKDGCVALEPTSDCQMSEGSEDEWEDSGRKSWQADEGADRPYTCSVCGKSFRIKSILTRHMKTHTGEKPYNCSICGKGFIQRSYLQTHMNSHSGQKPHTCSFCGRGFTQVGNMNAHMRIHTGEKPHSCADCGKSFREKADLIKHTIIHTGEKPYICAVCNMRFSAQSNLTRHTKTHSGERPYSCTACGKRFIRRSHLIMHTKTHTAENL